LKKNKRFFLKKPPEAMRWCGVPQEEEELRKVNRKIDKEIELERKIRKKEVKILLLGTLSIFHPIFSFF